MALFTYAYENGAADMRLHADADYVPGFQRFDLVFDERVSEGEAALAPVPAT